MAQTEVFFFREPKDGSVPLLEWLDGLPTKVKANELRASYQGVLYRMLYFFAGKAVVVLVHGRTKEREVPPREIHRAVERKKKVENNFERFTFRPG